MIAEYLDRSSLVARMKYYEEHTTEESGEHYAYSVALREIRNAPAADVAEVVRCKDCRHSKYAAWCEGYACCRTVGEYHHADFGCTAGKPRTNGVTE